MQPGSHGGGFFDNHEELLAAIQREIGPEAAEATRRSLQLASNPRALTNAERAELIEFVYQPLLGGGPALLDTVTTYLEQGSSLEATARLLFVHPNTVRYRLRRVSELTGLMPSNGRDAFALWLALVLGRLAHKSA